MIINLHKIFISCTWRSTYSKYSTEYSCWLNILC